MVVCLRPLRRLAHPTSSAAMLASSLAIDYTLRILFDLTLEPQTSFNESTQTHAVCCLGIGRLADHPASRQLVLDRLDTRSRIPSRHFAVPHVHLIGRGSDVAVGSTLCLADGAKHCRYANREGTGFMIQLVIIGIYLALLLVLGFFESAVSRHERRLHVGQPQHWPVPAADVVVRHDHDRLCAGRIDRRSLQGGRRGLRDAGVVQRHHPLAVLLRDRRQALALGTTPRLYDAD